MTDDAAAAPLRIVHCFRSPVGGIFRHVRDLVEEHGRAGHLVGVVCDSSTGGAHEDRLFAEIEPLLALGLHRFAIGRSVGPGDIVALLKGYRHIASLRPDILHGHGAKGGVVARLIGSVLKLSGHRVARLYSPHGGSLHYGGDDFSGRLVLRTERLLEAVTDALCFVCRYEEQIYAQKIGAPRVGARTIHNGVRAAEFLPVDTGPRAAQFLYIGMLRDLKGPDVFIEAFARAEQVSGLSLSGLMVGDGPDRDKYARMIEGFGLAGRLAMRPAMPARDAFALARTVVVPSRAEAMPYIVLEALAAGKAVIASHVGGIPEILGPNGPTLVAPGDADALARLMAKDVAEPGWALSAMPPRDELQARFSTPAMAAAMLALYRELPVRQGRAGRQ